MRAACPSRQWPQRCAWPRPCPARATLVAACRCPTAHRRAPQAVVATLPHRSPARPRYEDHRRARPEIARPAPCFPLASTPSAPRDPRRSQQEQSPAEILRCACATHRAYARSAHAPRKTPCDPVRSAGTPKPDAQPLPGSADEPLHLLRLHSYLNFNTVQKTKKEWGCSNAYEELLPWNLADDLQPTAKAA